MTVLRLTRAPRSQVPYVDLYDLDTCAKFVSEYITYEPLDLQVRTGGGARAVVRWQRSKTETGHGSAGGYSLTSTFFFFPARRRRFPRTSRPPTR